MRGLLDVCDALGASGDCGSFITLFQGSEDCPGIDGWAEGHHCHKEGGMALAAEGAFPQESLFLLGSTDLLCLVLPLFSAEVKLLLFAQGFGTDSPCGSKGHTA